MHSAVKNLALLIKKWTSRELLSLGYHSPAEVLYVHVHALNLRYKKVFPKPKSTVWNQACSWVSPCIHITLKQSIKPHKSSLKHFTAEKSKLDWSSLAGDSHTRVFSTTEHPQRGSKKYADCTEFIDKTWVIHSNFRSLKHRQVVSCLSPYSELQFPLITF